MENASKALIIAGSILVAVLVIAFGIRIYKDSSGSGDQLKTTVTIAEMAQFNGKFSGYAGSNKSPAKAKALADLVIAHNANSSRKISLNGKTSSNDIMTEAANITKSCTITLKDNYIGNGPNAGADGYIDTITITQ